MKTQESKKILIFNILVTAFILIQPFLDIYKSLAPVKLELFGISLIEIINIILISAIVLITLNINLNKINKKNKKTLILLSCLILIYFVYIVLHAWNILKFDTAIYPNNKINAITETYYILRALIEPLVLMLCIYINKFPKKNFYLIITILTYIVCGLIVISNIFNFSLVAYSDTNKIISGNIFSWFTFSDTYVKPLTSKGLFFSANELSNLMVILFPLNISIWLKNKRITDYIALIIQMLSMLMLGTKTATLGLIGIIIGTLLLKILLILKDIKNAKKYISNILALILIFLCISPIIYYCPLFIEYRADTITPESTDEIDTNKEEEPIVIEELDFDNYDCNHISKKDKNKLIEYMENNHYTYGISEYYTEKYTIANDIEFWCQTYQDQNSSLKRNRELKTLIFQRVFDKNNKTSDKYLGLGYTLDMLNLETDYKNLYFEFGILGLILFVGPYFILFILSGLLLLKNLKKGFIAENILLFASVFCGIVSPHISGHLYGNLIVSLPLSLTTIMLFMSMKEKDI